MNARLYFKYKNHKGEVAWRQVIPIRLYYGTTQYYPEEQYLLEARDMDKKECRTFAVSNIKSRLMNEHEYRHEMRISIGLKNQGFTHE